MKQVTIQTTITPLGRPVRVHILLPADYEQSDKRYPVLYLHDGQDVFRDEDTFGSYESLRLTQYYDRFGAFMPGLIAVAIEAPEDRPERTAQLSPFTKHFDVPPGKNFESYIEGKGIAFLDWITTELKPTIDQTYRTMPDAQHTGICGFSSGALNSIYAGLCYPHIFSRFIAISPATYLWMDCLGTTLKRADYSHLRYVYLDVGTNEYSRMGSREDYLDGTKQLYQAFTAGGLDENRLLYCVFPKGTHTNLSWRPRLPDAIRWIYQDFA